METWRFSATGSRADPWVENVTFRGFPTCLVLVWKKTTVSPQLLALNEELVL